VGTSEGGSGFSAVSCFWTRDTDGILANGEAKVGAPERRVLSVEQTLPESSRE
jgi:hypothetical protein